VLLNGVFAGPHRRCQIGRASLKKLTGSGEGTWFHAAATARDGGRGRGGGVRVRLFRDRADSVVSAGCILFFFFFIFFFFFFFLFFFFSD
jgi:hypothetical protein